MMRVEVQEEEEQSESNSARWPICMSLGIVPALDEERLAG